jgi:uncharacterized phage-like protein YoqJ
MGISHPTKRRNLKVKFTSLDYTNVVLPENKIVVAFTGHRPRGRYTWMGNPNSATSQELRRIVERELADLHTLAVREGKGVLCLTGGALGFDILAGYSANRLKSIGVEHIVCIPFYGQWRRWNATSIGYYQHVIDNATGYRYVDIHDKKREIVTPIHETGELPYDLVRSLLLHRNVHMITHCDRLVAFFDGSRGGTYHAVSRYPAIKGAKAPMLRIKQTEDPTKPFDIYEWEWRNL